jgi:hypothetical protein
MVLALLQLHRLKDGTWRKRSEEQRAEEAKVEFEVEVDADAWAVASFEFDHCLRSPWGHCWPSGDVCWGHLHRRRP